MVLSNGVKITWKVPESEKSKKLQRLLSRKEKGTWKHKILKHRLQREHEKTTNIKKDIINKVCSLLYRYKLIAYQDDNFHAWHKTFLSKSIQHSSIGGITRRLSSNRRTPVKVVDRYIPTTQTCYSCGHRQKVELSQREFKCEECRIEINRDLNSAMNMLKVVGVDCSEGLNPMPAEMEIETLNKLLDNLPYVEYSIVEVGIPLFQ